MSGKKKQGVARACANIALAKYWGKADKRWNVPAVPSISMTLDRLVTQTQVTFDPSLRADELRIDGRRTSRNEAARITELLDRVRKQARLKCPARVHTRNDFPTAAGLASSASGFAALAAAASSAAGLRMSDKMLSAMARQSSASAARSIHGGFVELPAGKRGQRDLSARPIAPADHWDVQLVIAITEHGPKKVGSTEAMERSRKTSPYYDAWLDIAPGLARKIKRGIKERDLELVGHAMERSTLAFHSCAITADPSILYWSPVSLAAMTTVRELREKGVAVWFTMDAGPHVKALCHTSDVIRVKHALAKTVGVKQTIVAKPGPGIQVDEVAR